MFRGHRTRHAVPHRSGRGPKLRRPGSVFAVVIGLAIALGLAVPLSARAAGSAEGDDAAARIARWSEDLDSLAKELPERHVDFFHSLSREAFRRDVAAVRASIESSTDAELTLRFMRLAASAGDGHTRVAGDFASFRALPLSMYVFADGVGVIAATEAYAEHVGSRVVAIGDKSIDELEAALAPFISHDNRSGLLNQLPSYLLLADALQEAGAIDSVESARVTFEADGERKTVDMETVPVPELRTMTWKPIERSAPLCEQKMQFPHWNDWIADAKTLYFKYNACHDAEGFNRLVNGTVGFIEQNDVERFVLDLRHNGGGNSVIFAPLQRWLAASDFNRPGGLYVILGRRTFSSALLNALDLRSTSAIFVGEPTGGRPNHFGEVKTFQLPNSGLTVAYSTKYFRRIPDADPPSMEPDIHVEPTFEQWKAGQDPVLETVLAHRVAGDSKPKKK